MAAAGRAQTSSPGPDAVGLLLATNAPRHGPGHQAARHINALPLFADSGVSAARRSQAGAPPARRAAPDRGPIQDTTAAKVRDYERTMATTQREEEAMVGRELNGTKGPREEGEKVMQYVAAFLATIGALAAGTALAWTAPTLDLLKAADSFLPITDDEGSWIGSLMAIGAGLGAVPAGALTDKLGRKTTMLVLAVPFVLSWLLILFASNVPMLYAARFIGGLATGATSVAAPMYAAEIAEVSIRGTLGAFFQLQVTVGILLTFVVGGFSGYKTLATVSLVVPIAWFAAVLFLPETPLYLLKQGRPSDAEAALRRLRGASYRGLKAELGEMQRNLQEAARNDSSLGELLKSRAVIKGLVICLALMVFQQVSGINAIMFYTVDIFKAAGSTLDPSIATIIVGVVQVLATLTAAMLVEKAGRRVLLLGSAAVMAAMHILLGVYFYMANSGSDVSKLGWLPLMCVVVFVVVFSLAFGPIPWMMAGEIFTDEVKGPASTIAAAVNWTMAFAVTKVFSAMMEGIGTAGTFWIFGGCCVAATAFVLVVVFETKGKSQQEVQDILSGGRSR